jgi:hypothetical protein
MKDLKYGKRQKYSRYKKSKKYLYDYAHTNRNEKISVNITFNGDSRQLWAMLQEKMRLATKVNMKNETYFLLAE